MAPRNAVAGDDIEISRPVRTRPRIGGLDGLRALAVSAVVLYHLSPRALPSGYLGVDVFMVISGFIVTTLLLREYGRDGRVRVGAFWGRRFRRLVPALVFMLVVVSIWARLVMPSTLLPQVRAQGLSALFYVTNWQLIHSSVSYGGATAALSPFVHLWSLAVEEQFYLVWPLLLFGLLRLGRGRRTLAIVVSIAGAIASAALMAWIYHGGSGAVRAYYGTDTRAQAFLAGAVAAMLAPWLRGRMTRVIAVGGGIALVGVVAIMFTDAPDQLYQGGFALVAVATAVAVLASTASAGPVVWCCDRGPLRALGRVSYGVYLWHWPAVVLLTPARTGLAGLSLALLRLAVTAIATTISWIFVERRFAGWHAPRVAWRGAAAVATAGIALVALPASSVVAFADYNINHIPTPTVALPNVSRARVTKAKHLAPRPRRRAPAHPAPTPLVLPAAGTAMIVGDSGMTTATPAFTAALQAAGWRVVQTAFPGEGLTRPDDVRTRWAASARQYHVDLTIVMIGGWDVGWVDQHGAAAYRAVVADAYNAYTAGGGKVLWLSIMPGGASADSPDRGLDHYYQAIVQQHPGSAEYLEVAPALEAPTGGWPQFVNGQRYRMRDGWHLCPSGAAALVHFTLARIGLDRGGWDAGSWRASADYRDPWNACTVP